MENVAKMARIQRFSNYFHINRKSFKEKTTYHLQDHAQRIEGI